MNTNMLGTKVGLGTSVASAVIANLPHIEAGLRIAAAIVAIIAGVYAILNYHFDFKRKRELYEKEHPDSVPRHRRRRAGSARKGSD